MVNILDQTRDWLPVLKPILSIGIRWRIVEMIGRKQKMEMQRPTPAEDDAVSPVFPMLTQLSVQCRKSRGLTATFAISRPCPCQRFLEFVIR